MLNVLHLTDAERAIWQILKPAIQEGWTVEPENGNVRDSPDRRDMRMQLLRLKDPKLLAFGKKAHSAANAEALAALLAETDLTGVIDADLAELFFALGPATVGTLIESMLRSIKTDADVEGIAALTTIRRSLYQAMIPA